ncbi:hypothetical protein [Vibrio rarus]|uniref:hypothetical protein n=1 Tax=Vibrio rarus TaxID=413403 RepID=UPI0021C26D91|nr:hypothetical protein [Vibrio rarus]
MNVFKLIFALLFTFMLSVGSGYASASTVSQGEKSGFAFNENTHLYNALDSFYFFATQQQITPQNLRAGLGSGIAQVLKSGAFSHVPSAGIKKTLVFDGNHPLTLSETGAKTLNAAQWHCYNSSSIVVSVDRQGMTLDGIFTEYQYVKGCNVANKKVIAYQFKHAHINRDFIIDSGHITDLSTSKKIPANQLLLASIEQSVAQQFGKAWLEQWKLGASSAGAHFLQLENGRVVYKEVPSSMQDFNLLDKRKILAGTVFGHAPGIGHASAKWCRIINIPKGLDLESQKVQTMIAVNCARSSHRYCEGHASDFPAGMQPATYPLAWSDASYKLAMDNTVLQQKFNQQGHFETNNQAQNAFTVTPYNGVPFSGALKAVFGYTDVKDPKTTSAHFNNAGANSFTGHAGHCQNEMTQHAMSTGLSFIKLSKKGVTGIDFITQNFAK